LDGRREEEDVKNSISFRAHLLDLPSSKPSNFYNISSKITPIEEDCFALYSAPHSDTKSHSQVIQKPQKAKSLWATIP
jgi:hypothetical protein